MLRTRDMARVHRGKRRVRSGIAIAALSVCLLFTTLGFYHTWSVTTVFDQRSNASNEAEPPKNILETEESTEKPKIQFWRIPHNLFFTHRVNLLKSDVLEQVKHEKEKTMFMLLQKNVKNTIQLYTDLWSSKRRSTNGLASTDDDTTRSDINVRFLTDTECMDIIQQAEPRLLPYFRAETGGMYKSDICRVAALYLWGGYYLDADLQVVRPVDLEDDAHEDHIGGGGGVSFATVRTTESNNFFQAYLASVSHHPVLKEALDTMLDYYRLDGHEKPKYLNGSWMGPVTLNHAYNRVRDKVEEKKKANHEEWKEEKELVSSALFLTEERLDQYVQKFGTPDDPYVARGQAGRGCCCNYIVFDDPSSYSNFETKKKPMVHFFSRIVGYKDLCDYP